MGMNDGSEDSDSEKTGSSRALNTCVGSNGFLELIGSNRHHEARNRLNGTDLIRFDAENERVQSCVGHFDNRVNSSGVCGSGRVGNVASIVDAGDVSLRQWLDKPERNVDILECLHIFKQIVEIVRLAHSQGIVVHNVRPSCFIMSSFNRISFIESASCSSSSSDSVKVGLKNILVSDHTSSSSFPQSFSWSRNDVISTDLSPLISSLQTLETNSFQSHSAYMTCPSSEGDRDEERKGKVNQRDDRKKTLPLKPILHMELIWYTSPEELDGASSSISSDVYRLGVLLFELFCTSSSVEEKLGTMLNLRHRVLPSQLLLKWPKEASFCLWLLHPQPNTRPRLNEVLESEFLNEPRNSLEDREAAVKLKEEIEEQELLLEFLLQLQQRKQETASKLQEIILCLTMDMDEVLKQKQSLRKPVGISLDVNNESSILEKAELPSVNSARDDDSTSLSSRKRYRQGLLMQRESFEDEGFPSETHKGNYESLASKSSRLMKNFKKLESAYFSSRLVKPVVKLPCQNFQVSSLGRGSIARTEGSSIDNLVPRDSHQDGRRRGWINPFLEGLCKYLSFSKLKVRADLKQGDLLNSSNLVCSLGFDRDKDFFATAGVNRKIKIFECNMILNEDRDIHYPVIEMGGRSKFSSICWNSYIKGHIASSDFEGIVQVWDVTRGQVYAEMREHERRVWSIDFSLVDPTKLVSGSDDGTVKLWNINQRASIGTIRTRANVCCVQFSPESSRSLTIGSADHRIYCYDLRNATTPLSTLVGHTKTVSYVKYVDSTTLVSASTDNSLKLWDLSTNTRVQENPLQTFTGHTNMKNFVGLSISDGYIATGSETNEVFVYHKAFPMPVLSFKFNNTDPLSGQEVDDSSQFISSVCWRGQSSTMLAANSTGNIKILEMV